MKPSTNVFKFKQETAFNIYRAGDLAETGMYRECKQLHGLKSLYTPLPPSPSIHPTLPKSNKTSRNTFFSYAPPPLVYVLIMRVHSTYKHLDVQKLKTNHHSGCNLCVHCYSVFKKKKKPQICSYVPRLQKSYKTEINTSRCSDDESPTQYILSTVYSKGKMLFFFYSARRVFDIAIQQSSNTCESNRKSKLCVFSDTSRDK